MLNVSIQKWGKSMSEFVRPNIFLSACIEFESCRHDGELIRDDYVRRLIKHVNVIRVCPELAIGLGAPRDAIRLVERKGEELKLLSINEGVDLTDKMVSFSAKYAASLKEKEIDGFILKAKSPTCGISTVKIYHDIGKSNVKSAKNSGLFGRELQRVFPTMPIETERRLSNYKIRNRFFTELFVLADFRSLKTQPTTKKLVQFQTKNKYLFMVYNQVIMKQMGNIVANHNNLPLNTVYETYEVKLRALLSKEASMKKRINVLTHIYGYFKHDVATDEKEYYFELLDQYLNNQIPYSNVLFVLKGWAIRFKQEYLKMQTIFEPYPKDLIMVTDSGKKI